MKNLHIVVADGAGGICYGLSFAYLLKANLLVDIHMYLICSEEVFKLVKSLPGPYRVNFYHYPPETNEENLLEELGLNNSLVYRLTPDKCHIVDRYRPPFEDWGLTWQKVKENKFLAPYYSLQKRNKKIFLGFQSSQNNIYPYLTELICNLCEKMPDYIFNFIFLKSWSDKERIDYGIRPREVLVYPNFNIVDSNDICKDFDWILRSHDSIICTDNGLSNIAYFAGKTRYLVDTRYASLAMFLRWRQTYNDILPGNLSPEVISSVVKICEKYPELTGLPRSGVANLIANYDIKDLSKILNTQKEYTL